MHKINEIDLLNVDCYMVNGETGAQIIEWAKEGYGNKFITCYTFSWSRRR
jgi:hypothetical protein